MAVFLLVKILEVAPEIHVIWEAVSTWVVVNEALLLILLITVTVVMASVPVALVAVGVLMVKASVMKIELETAEMKVSAVMMVMPSALALHVAKTGYVEKIEGVLMVMEIDLEAAQLKVTVVAAEMLVTLVAIVPKYLEHPLAAVAVVGEGHFAVNGQA